MDASATAGSGFPTAAGVTLKNLPGTEPDVTYTYDNLSRLTGASQTGNALSFGWDALSRKTSEGGAQGTTTFAYDAADRRTSITYPSTTALTVAYAYLVTGELDTIKQGAATLADYGYDNLGVRTGVVFEGGSAQGFGRDAVSRLASLTNDLAGTASDLSVTFAYNPASQIKSTVRTGDAYAWTGHGNGSTAFTQNGLNQQATIGGVTAGWDGKGNLITEPQTGKSYGYSSENLLTSATGGVTLGYDPALRLYQTAGAATTRLLYDGVDAIAEYNGSNALQRRFVFDPTTGQPVLWYEGTGTAATNRRYLGQDERGSVISVASNTGAMLGVNTYDEYGKPGTANLGRYQYTGQKWIGEAGLYDYKARDYLPHLGIFAQTDPIGREAGPNLYAYVLNDPINWVDPLGLDEWVNCIGQMNCGGGIDDIFGPGRKAPPCPAGDICITGKRLRPEIPSAPLPVTISTSPATPAPAKPKSGTTTPTQPSSEDCAAQAGLAVGVVTYLSLEYPTVVGVAASAARGARVGALIGEFGGPVALGSGIVLGGLTGIAVYFLSENRGDKSQSSKQATLCR